MNPLAFLPFFKNSLCLEAFLQIKQQTDGASVRGRGVAAGTWVKALNEALAEASLELFLSEQLSCLQWFFCCKHLNWIFISLFHYKSACLLRACVECGHCKAVPRSALLSRRTRCGVEECFKHTLSNPFLLSSLEGVCSFQQSNPLISIPHSGWGADSSKLGYTRLVKWALPEKGVFNKVNLKSTQKWFCSVMSNCWLRAICLVKICFPTVPLRPLGTVTLTWLLLLQARGWSSVPSAPFTASCHESSQ